MRNEGKPGLLLQLQLALDVQTPAMPRMLRFQLLTPQQTAVRAGQTTVFWARGQQLTVAMDAHGMHIQRLQSSHGCTPAEAPAHLQYGRCKAVQCLGGQHLSSSAQGA